MVPPTCNSKDDRHLGRSQYLPVVFIIAGGFIASIIIHFILQGNENREIANDFQYTTKERITILERRIDSTLLAMDSLSAFYASSREVDRDEFRMFVEPILRHQPEIRTLKWIPRVTDEQRTSFEESFRSRWDRDFQICVETATGQMVQAISKKEFYPVCYVEPLSGNERVVGFDLSSETDWSVELNESRDNGKTITLNSSTFPYGSDRQNTVFIIRPCYRKNMEVHNVTQRREHHIGFLVGAVRVDKLIELCISKSKPEDFDFYLCDISTSGKERLLFSYSDVTAKATEAAFSFDKILQLKTGFSKPVQLPDRTWLAVCIPTRSFYAGQRSWHSYSAMIIGFMLTGLIAIYVRGSIADTVSSIATNRLLNKEIVKYKRIEDELRGAKEYTENIISSMLNMLVVISPDGRLITVNKATIDTLGYSSEELIWKPMHVLFADSYDETGLEKNPFDKVTQDGKSLFDYLADGDVIHNIETTLVKRNGETIPVLLSGSVLHNSAGEVTGAVCVAQNLTDRKQVEAKLNTLLVAVEQSPASVVITDFEGTIEYVNPKFSEVTGYAAEEAIGKNPRILKSGKWPAHLYTEMWEKLRSGEVWTGEFENRKKNGEIYWEAASICPIEDERGRITHFLAVKLDISDRKLAEDQLRYAHDQTRKLLESIPLVLITLEKKNIVTDWNIEAENAFGISAADAVGRELECLDIEWEKGELLYLITQCRRGGETTSKPEMRLNSSERGVRFFNVVLAQIGNIELAGDRLLLIASDVTEQRVLQSQVAQTQKLESIGELAAGIAHEINTPTQFVSDNTRFLQSAFPKIHTVLDEYKKLLDACRNGSNALDLLDGIEEKVKKAKIDFLLEQVPEAISDSLEGLERVAKIVRAMKDFSHPGEEDMCAADLNKAIESTVTVARNEWKYVADVELDLDPELPPVPCVLGDFNQVILNMIVNAAHAISEALPERNCEKGKITVSTRYCCNEAKVSISDTGIGIPVENRIRIFDHFFTTKQVGKGTGQGLAIAHSVIAERHKGKITFETEVGKGTTFIIHLPLECNSKETESKQEVDQV